MLQAVFYCRPLSPLSKRDRQLGVGGVQGPDAFHLPVGEAARFLGRRTLSQKLCDGLVSAWTYVTNRAITAIST